MTAKPEATTDVPKRGYFFVIAAALLWGLSGTAAKFLFQIGITPFSLVQMRLTGSATFLFLALLVRQPRLLYIQPRDILYFVVLGTVGMATVQFTYLFAISKINVAAAILLQYLAPNLIALYTVIVLHEKLTGTTVLALLSATFGCYLVVGAYHLDVLRMNELGIGSGLLSAASFAWYSIHGERGMRRYPPWTVLFYALFFSMLLWHILEPPFHFLDRSYSSTEWLLIFYIVLLGTLVPFGLYFEGINLIRSTRASITATLEPITAGVASYLFLHEVLELWQMIGDALVIGAVIGLQIKRERDEKTPALLRAHAEDGAIHE